MTRGLGYAPTAGKAKTIATPDASKNNKPVPSDRGKRDTNPVKGTRAARPQKPVTWS